MRFLVPLALTLALAACAEAPRQETATPEPAAAAEGTPDDLSSCGASALAGSVGDFLVAGTAGPGEVNVDDLPQPNRIIGPGMAMTMDYRRDRLTVEVDGRGRILSLRCV
ncbi:I78 family peptidase inhibitor [Caenispirillum bisanense]|uniref:Peptidase inhibitor I78 family protein n=1 Tax=Caenispirillum bisanense TaxID=414052 RepID=A0A286GW97_9PROT|nr:I78 family peptidase inhibitor [Caenispirillum bisanense]SOD99815.1 Peptidase inhibitor I78 family protein [Caenispirillum bisanense]